MGRTIPSYRIAIEMERSKWKSFRERLDKKDRKEFDKMISYSRLYNSAASNACRPQLIHPILMSILLEHHKQLEILRKSVADKYLIIQRADFSCSFRCCTSIKTSDLSGSLSWLLTLFIQFSRLFALLYRSRDLFSDILIPSLPDKYTIVYSLKIFLFRFGIRTEGSMDWVGFEPTTFCLRSKHSYPWTTSP